MNYAFNLIDEPWLPCIDVSGQLRSYSLRSALVDAHQLVELSGESPLVTAALHRLLLAVLHRALDGPRSKEEWWSWYEAGQFDAGRLDAYFERWRDRFDLFDDRYPFYQSPALKEEYASAVTKLTEASSSGNNAAFFDHSLDDQPKPLRPAVAARLVVTHQGFALGGLVSLEKGQDPARYKSAKAAPLANTVVFLAAGSNLFETLMLNLARYDPARGYPFETIAKAPDAPPWEREPAADIAERYPAGHVDLLTWQSRRIRLCADADPSPLVSRVIIMRGDAFPAGFSLQGREQMVAFHKIQSRDAKDPWPPLAFREGRALWRDSTVILQSAETHERPRILGWLDDLGASSDRLSLSALGLASDRAKPEFWREERFPLPVAYLHDRPALRGALDTALKLAEDCGSLLSSRGPLRMLAATLLGDGGKLQDFLDGLGGERAYWAALDQPFRTLLQRLPDDVVHTADIGDEYGLEVLPIWTGEVERAARDAFRVATDGLHASARGMEAVATCEGKFEARLAGLVRRFEGKEVPV